MQSSFYLFIFSHFFELNIKKKSIWLHWVLVVARRNLCGGMQDLVPDEQLNPGAPHPQCWEHGVIATELPGKSLI